MKQQKKRKPTAKNCGGELNREYVSFPEAARMLGVGIATVRTLAKRGTLKTFSYGEGMHVRISLASVNALVAKRKGAANG